MLIREGNKLLLNTPAKTWDLQEDIVGQGTGPFYLYDLDAVAERFQKMQNQFTDSYAFHYAMKANHNPHLMKKLKSLGSGVDVVSIGEFQWALEQGFAAQDIVFSGVGKTEEELREALQLQVGQINVESEAEFFRIARLAKDLKLVAPVALRVNPDVEAETHPYIRTGMLENKFGVEFNVVDKLLSNRGEWKNSICLVGISFHIGSQIRESAPFEESVTKTLQALGRWKELAPELEMLDIGGGVGIDYHSQDLEKDLELWGSYAKSVRSHLDPLLDSGVLKKVLMEPGRFLVGRFGYLFTQVQYVKANRYKKFVIVDTGMHHLMRPSLYQAYHEILPLNLAQETMEVADVVGPICESADVIGHDRSLPKDIGEGDWLVILDAGAYGYVMANSYNMHPLPQERCLLEGKEL